MFYVEIEDCNEHVTINKVLKIDLKWNLVLDHKPRVYIEIASQLFDLDSFKENDYKWEDCYIKTSKDYKMGAY